MRAGRLLVAEKHGQPLKMGLRHQEQKGGFGIDACTTRKGFCALKHASGSQLRERRPHAQLLRKIEVAQRLACLQVVLHKLVLLQLPVT